jgi:hypothetical protein
MIENFANDKEILRIEKKWNDRKFFEKFEKKIRIERNKRKSEKRWFLYVKFDVWVTDEDFCEMIWLSRFYHFYVFYERVSLFDQFVIRILCNLRTHFFVWSMSHSYFM